MKPHLIMSHIKTHSQISHGHNTHTHIHARTHTHTHIAPNTCLHPCKHSQPPADAAAGRSSSPEIDYWLGWSVQDFRSSHAIPPRSC